MRNNQFHYECKKCGNCCRAGLEVVIEKQDIETWIRARKDDFSKYLQIDPKCISLEGLAGFHIEEKNTIQKIKDKFKDEKVNKKIQQLKRFIIENHFYLGKGKPLPVYIFIEDLERMPILVPKSLKIVLKGLKWDLVYLLNFEPGGYCPFLKDNHCSIHDIKPNVCRNFPYNKNGELKIDEYFLKICQGLYKKESMK